MNDKYIQKIIEKITEKYLEFKENAPKEIPIQISVEYKLAFAGCIFKNYPQISIKKLSEIMEMDDTTIGRFKRKLYLNHKKLWDFIDNSDFCKNYSFDEFILNKLKSLSPSTISKKKFYNDYYKKFLEQNKFEKLTIKRIGGKISLEDTNKIKRQNLKKRKTINEFNSMVEVLKSDKNAKKLQRKINILATTKSSNELQQLAKDFNCEIKEISNQFSKLDNLIKEKEIK